MSWSNGWLVGWLLVLLLVVHTCLVRPGSTQLTHVILVAFLMVYHRLIWREKRDARGHHPSKSSEIILLPSESHSTQYNEVVSPSASVHSLPAFILFYVSVMFTLCRLGIAFESGMDPWDICSIISWNTIWQKSKTETNGLRWGHIKTCKFNLTGT